jgi:hypothetical protein
MILLIGLYSLITSLYSSVNFISIYFMKETLIMYLILFIPLILIILSIFSIFYIIKRRYSRILLIYPIYFLIYVFGWLVLIPSIVGYFVPLNESLNILEFISKFDVLFYVVDILFSVFILYKIHTDKVLFTSSNHYHNKL